MITLVGFQCNLFKRLELFIPQSRNLVLENDLGGCCRIDTVCLDGNDDMSTLFQETVRIVRNDTSLIWLRNIREDDINGGYEHAVFVRETSVFHNCYKPDIRIECDQT